MRKGKMSAKLDIMARSGSSGSEDSANEYLNGVRKTMNSSHKIWQTSALPKIDGTPAFDKADGFLDKAQSLCERAAHQVLRDGDCALEINNAKEHLANARKVSEAELPALRKRAEKAAEKRRISEERRKREVEEKKNNPPVEKVEGNGRLGSPPMELEVDELEVDELEVDELEADELEVDESEDEKVEANGRLGSPATELEVDELEVDESEDEPGAEQNVRPLVDTLRLSKFNVRTAARRPYRLAAQA